MPDSIDFRIFIGKRLLFILMVYALCCFATIPLLQCTQ
jgi:hypothetical protein